MGSKSTHVMQSYLVLQLTQTFVAYLIVETTIIPM